MPRQSHTAARTGWHRWAALGAAACLLALGASCHDPQAPQPAPPASDDGWSGTFRPGDETIEFRLEGTGGQMSSLRLVAGEIDFDSTQQHLLAQVAILNTGSEPVRGPEGVLVGGFDPSAVQPVNADAMPCPECIPCPCPFPWVFDYRGTYGDDGELGPGETSAPVEWILFDPAGESFSFRARVEAGSTADAGTVSGHVFVDVNANGVRDPDEFGIPNVMMSLNHGENSSATQTDEHGRFSFEVSEPGLYEVVRVPAGDCRPTTPSSLQVLIVRRADGSLSGYDRADFGCGGRVPPDSNLVFAGVVFEDLDRDGVRDRGEPGVLNVGVEAWGGGCPTFAPIRTITDENGAYHLLVPLCGMPPYFVGHDPVPGYVDTSPNPLVFFGTVLPGDSLPGSLPPGLPGLPARRLQADFGIAPADAPTDSATVGGFVFRDANRNGQMDAGEPGVAGVRVTASSLLCMIPILAETTTDAAGHYLLTQPDVHCPLPWVVGHDGVPEACDTTPNPVIVGSPSGGMSDTMPPLVPPGVYEVNFGVAACDTVPVPVGFGIQGFVYLDADGDGRRDRGESGVPGAVISLESPCDVWRATTTDARGHYVFRPAIVAQCPVAAVRLAEPDFPVHTTPNPLPVDPATVPPGGMLAASFGVRQPGPDR